MQYYNYANNGLVFNHNIDEHPDPAHFKLHAHSTFELFFFISGHATYLVEGQIYDLKPGDILLMRNNETHKMQIRPGYPYERISINIEPELFKESVYFNAFAIPFLERPLGHLNIYSKSDYEKSSINDNIDALRTLNNNCQHPGSIIISNVFSILCELVNIFEEKSKLPIKQELPREIIEYINNNISNQISLDSIGNHFYLSTSQINRIFKKYTGTSVFEYIKVKRLMLAKDLLAKGLSPGTTAKKCGFNDYTSFYKAYKTRFGISPKTDHIKKR